MVQKWRTCVAGIFSFVSWVLLTFLGAEVPEATHVPSEGLFGAAYVDRQRRTLALGITLFCCVQVQTINNGLFWHRFDNVYLRCAGLVGIDVLMVALAAALYSLNAPSSFEFENEKWEPGHHRMGKTFSAEDDLIRDLERVDTIRTIFWMSVADLIVHALAVLFWTRLMPVHSRLPNAYRPVLFKEEKATRMGVGRQDRRNSSLSTERLVQSSESLGQLFQQHDRAWRASRNRRDEDQVRHMTQNHCNV